MNVFTAFVFLGTYAVIGADPKGSVPAVPESQKVAIERGLKRMEDGITGWWKNQDCFCCHHQGIGLVTFNIARKHGFDVDPKRIKLHLDYSTDALLHRELDKPTPANLSWGLMAMHYSDYPDDEHTQSVVSKLIERQNPDGSWNRSSIRPPSGGSNFTPMGMVTYVVKAYGTGPLKSRADESVKKAVDWLIKNKGPENEDKVFRLRGLVFGGAPQAVIDDAREELLRDQRPDGSWAQTPSHDGDAYATGTALVALKLGGLDPYSPQYQKGVSYLIRTQRTDGAWIVEKRGKPVQAYFDNGDPGGISQFISHWGTSWATLALIEATPIQTLPPFHQLIEKTPGSSTPNKPKGEKVLVPGDRNAPRGSNPNSRTGPNSSQGATSNSEEYSEYSKKEKENGKSGNREVSPAKPYPNGNIIIEANELATPGVSGKFRILDTRPKEAYEKGHIPGAFRVDGKVWGRDFFGNSDAGRARAVIENGLGSETKVVVYGAGITGDTARVWWLLKAVGVKDVRLLNGGWGAWVEAKGEVSQETPKIQAFKGEEGPSFSKRLATKDQILGSLESKSIQIIDARSDQEFLGEKTSAKVGGAIPGAKQLRASDLIDAKTQRFKGPDELAKIIKAAGVVVDKPAVTYCEGGGRASVAAFALELLGGTDVRNYYPGWSEWGNSEELPKQKPTSK